MWRHSDVDVQWRLFNDAQIYKIHSQDVVDSSAYILFYMRQDVKERRLANFWDVWSRKRQGLDGRQNEQADERTVGSMQY